MEAFQVHPDWYHNVHDETTGESLDPVLVSKAREKESRAVKQEAPPKVKQEVKSESEDEDEEPEEHQAWLP